MDSWSCLLAPLLVMILTAFAPNMSYGYFVESRSNASSPIFLFPTSPGTVDEMVKDPDSYTMKATNRELTVMFCDVRLHEDVGAYGADAVANLIDRRV